MKRIVLFGIAAGLGLSAAVGELVADVTLTNLYSFNGTDGANPQSGLVTGDDGNLYGTTLQGGPNVIVCNCGSVFRITPGGSLTNLHFFSGFPSDGQNPYTGLVLGSDSNFYGVAVAGGASFGGTVFQISASGSLTTLHSFLSSSDGASPESALVQGHDGEFYGTTTGGGAGKSGTVYRVSSSGTFTNLHSFISGVDEGGVLFAGLVQGSDSNFFGVTYRGGATRSGTVFRISATGTVTNLHSFSGPDGAWPHGELVQGHDGNFYGTTVQGGAGHRGTVFRISPSGSFTNLYSFNGPDGDSPFAGLVEGSDGSFYGTTDGGGGPGGLGTVFRISPGGNFTNLYSFTGPDGASPLARLVETSPGVFYGTTSLGGSHSKGTVFRLTLAMGGLWSGAGDLGDGWKWVEWFGYFNTNADPWIYHLQHGWLYAVGTDTGSVFFWDNAMATWWWTSAKTYPYIYRFSDSAWLWYQKDSANPRWFYNLTAGKWENW